MRSSRSSSVSSTSSSSASQPHEESIQIFVKTIAGNTIPLLLPPSTKISTLQTMLSLRLNLPSPTDLRLQHTSHHLSPSDTLASAHLTPESTLLLSLPLRGGMPPKLPRCDFKKDDPEHKCKEKIQPIVGECGFCEGRFCSKHRLLESHACSGLENCKKESYQRNKETLERERTVAIKGV